VNPFLERARSLKDATDEIRRMVHQFATVDEIAQVKAAAAASAGVGLVSAIFLHGVWPKLLVAGPLVGIGVALVVTLVHTAAFRQMRLRAGRCAYPLCHGVVQRSPRLPEGRVICPTCRREWPEAEGMAFLLTQRDAEVGESGAHSQH